MKKLVLLCILGLSGIAIGQTTSSPATITVTPAVVTHTVAIAPATQTAPAGTTVNLQVSVASSDGSVPAGSVDLMAKAPGASAYTLIQTFPLVNGSVTCTYPIPVTTPAGAYQVEAVYPSAGSAGQ